MEATRQPYDQVFENYESELEISRGFLIVRRPQIIQLRLKDIEGIILYRGRRVGFILSSDDVVDVPVSENKKLLLAELISKAAGVASAARAA